MRAPQPPSVLALGAWLKNAACLMVGERVIWSPLHGDLSHPAACEALHVSADRLLQHAAASGRPVQVVAHDLHPDFYSTQLALGLAQRLGVPAIGVQHHHAHVACIAAEHGLQGPVFGLALDGVGLGTDQQAWGGELLWLHGARWQRLGHLLPLALPGGDRAAREPWRMAASVLHALGRGEEITPRFALRVGAVSAQGVQGLLQKQLNCPPSSSAGRWFDAAAAALGLCLRQDDEAQAARALEAAAARALQRRPDLPSPGGITTDAANRLDLRALWAGLLDAADAGPDAVDEAAAGFHLALADALASWVLAAAQAPGLRAAGTQQPIDVCLGGGCFFNRILRERTAQRLREAGCRVHLAGPQGCGDAGLAWGQAWVAAQRWAAAAPELSPDEENATCA